MTAVTALPSRTTRIGDSVSQDLRGKNHVFIHMQSTAISRKRGFPAGETAVPESSGAEEFTGHVYATPIRHQAAEDQHCAGSGLRS